MAYEQYARATISVDGINLLQEASITVNRTSNGSPNITTQLGYNGDTPGAEMIEISVDNAVPSTQWEFDPGNYMSRFGGFYKGVTFIIQSGDMTLQFEGVVVSDNFTHAINSPAKLSFSARGKFTTTWE